MYIKIASASFGPQGMEVVREALARWVAWRLAHQRDREEGRGEAMGVAPRDGGGARGAGETGGVADGTLEGPLDARAMAVTDGMGAMTGDAGDVGDVGPCEGRRGGWRGGRGQARRRRGRGQQGGSTRAGAGPARR